MESLLDNEFDLDLLRDDDDDDDNNEDDFFFKLVNEFESLFEIVSSLSIIFNKSSLI